MGTEPASTPPGRFTDRQLLFGAALVQLVTRNLSVTIRESARSDNNLFVFSSPGGKSLVLFKYATQRRSPWHFTVTDAQRTLIEREPGNFPDARRFMALICHLDGVCLLMLEEFRSITFPGASQYGLSVSRPKNGSYRIRGPGRIALRRTVPRSRWTREILMC